MGATVGTAVPNERPDYGIDAPVVIRRCAIGAVLSFALNVGVPSLAPNAPGWVLGLADLAGVVGIGCVFVVALILYGSKIGKFRQRDRLLDSIPWRGDENTLDVGCGHGLLLIGAAKRAPLGRATGIDIWSQYDQADNSPEGPLENARIMGVADRVSVQDADARKLPFDDTSFDVVVSSLAIHNIEEKAGREQAIREISRVLKPGGHVAIMDIYRVYEYVRTLRELGFNVETNRPIWTPSITSPIRMTARKPRA